VATTPAEPGTWRVGRDPALLGALVLAAMQVALTLLPVTTDQAAVLNAFAAAAVGFVVAVAVRSDRWVPTLLGLIKAAGSVVIGFGLHWTPQSQAAAMLLGSAIAAVITRTQVVAPVAQAVVGPVAAPLVAVPSSVESGRHTRREIP
jgi:non-ribosomal peptide synthetase component F